MDIFNLVSILVNAVLCVANSCLLHVAVKLYSEVSKQSMIAKLKRDDA